MKRNTLFSFLTVAALGLVTAGPASAGNDTYTWVGGAASGSENDWDYNAGTKAAPDYANWNWNAAAGEPVTSLPNSGDTVVIPDRTHDPEIDSGASIVTFSTLNINTGGVLSIRADAVLNLDGTVAHDIDGDLVLSNSTAVVKFSASVDVDGDGKIVGQDNNAQVQVATNKVLTNRMSTVGIVGRMKIAGPGKLDNRGLVHANGDGPLELGENLLLDDTGGAVRWKAGDNINAILFFRNEHTGGSKLDGDFAVASCSKLKFDATIETNGDFDTGAAAGFVDVDAANSVEFRYDCDAGGGCTVIDSDQTYGGC